MEVYNVNELPQNCMLILLPDSHSVKQAEGRRKGFNTRRPTQPELSFRQKD